MKYIKLYENYWKEVDLSGDISEVRSFDNYEDFAEFYNSRPEMKEECRWSICPNVDQGKIHFKQYVKPGYKFVVVFVGDNFVGAVVKGEDVLTCFDKSDKECKKQFLENIWPQIKDKVN